MEDMIPVVKQFLNADSLPTLQLHKLLHKCEHHTFHAQDILSRRHWYQLPKVQLRSKVERLNHAWLESLDVDNPYMSIVHCVKDFHLISNLPDVLGQDG